MKNELLKMNFDNRDYHDSFCISRRFRQLTQIFQENDLR